MPEFLTYTFMQRALIAGLIVGIIAPLIGLFMVVRRYSGLADSLAHVSLVGVAISLIFGWLPFYGSALSSVLAGIGIEKLRAGKKIFGESALVVFLSGSLGLVSILTAFNGNFQKNLLSYLFGSITLIGTKDLLIISLISAIVFLFITLFYRQFFNICFDEEMAKLSGIKVGFFNLLLISLAALTVSAGIQIIGGLLMSSLMIIPPLTAMQFNFGFKQTLILAIIFSIFSVFTGLISSFYLNLPAGGTIVLANLILFLIGLNFNRK